MVTAIGSPLLRRVLPIAPLGCNDTGVDFWVFESEWYDDYATIDELRTMRSLFMADGIPFTEQHFPSRPAIDNPPDETWWSHPSLTAEERN